MESLLLNYADSPLAQNYGDVVSDDGFWGAMEYPRVNEKRGFVADGTDRTCNDPLLLNVSGWYYDYNVGDPYRAAGLSGDCERVNSTDQKRFTPMNWCFSSMDATVPKYVNQTYFMGFNEPNNSHNCNQPPKAVAEHWEKIINLHSGSLLVSPATAGNGVNWFDEFFGNCTELYGAKGCQISYLAAHDYSCNASSTLDYLKQLHKRYGYPVWLTEFSCGDHSAGRPTSDHIKYMREVVPLLDGADFVFRYAWMSARDSNGKRGLVETVHGQAQLTKLGDLWNSL